MPLETLTIVTYVSNPLYRLLKRFKLLDANNTNTLLPAGIHLEKSEEPVALDTKTDYQQIIRTLIYAPWALGPILHFQQ